MKKRQLALILAVCMGASLLGGCGNSADPAETEKVIGKVTEEEQEEVAEEIPAESVDVLVTAVEAMEEEAAADLIYATFKAVNGFAVEGLADTTMYAKQTVNVRRGPSADYEQMGSLSFGQEVTVTGIADTGWYQISYNEETGYCSNNYLATEKPVAQALSGGRDYKAEYDAALTAGNIDLAMQIMAESAGRTKEEEFGSTSGGSGNSSESGSSSASVEKSVASASGFVDYLNQQREAEGLGTLSWDSSMESTAQERASEIVDDFSHNGMRNCHGEIVGKFSSSSVSVWYDNFYASPGHRANMLSSASNRAAAAYCKVGNTYYVVVLFGI